MHGSHRLQQPLTGHIGCNSYARVTSAATAAHGSHRLQQLCTGHIGCNSRARVTSAATAMHGTRQPPGPAAAVSGWAVGRLNADFWGVLRPTTDGREGTSCPFPTTNKQTNQQASKQANKRASEAVARNAAGRGPTPKTCTRVRHGTRKTWHA
eukprot:364957-Chlamydomonas_euryale.AAC.3